MKSSIYNLSSFRIFTKKVAILSKFLHREKSYAWTFRLGNVYKIYFDATKNKLDYYRGIDCIKKLCRKLMYGK